MTQNSAQTNISLTAYWEQKLGRLCEMTKNRTINSGIYKCPIRLRGLGDNPILFLKNAIFPIEAATDFCSRPTAQIKLIVCLDEKSSEVLEQGWELPRKVVLITREDLKILMSDASPLERLACIVRERFDWLDLIPFNTSSPVYGNMFFGRSRELNELIHIDQDYALCGEGGMGKSSLLEQMVFKLRESSNPRYARTVRVDLIDCPPSLDAAANRIATAIHQDQRSQGVGLHNLLAFLKHSRHTLLQFQDGPIELIIDEMDKILHIDSLQKDAEGNCYPLMRVLRNARHARPDEILRLTISGRYQTQQLLAHPDNPFSVAAFTGKTNSRFRLIKLEAFDERTGLSLVRDPFVALGKLASFRYPKFVKRALDCKGVPFQLQSLGLDLCSELMNVS